MTKDGGQSTTSLSARVRDHLRYAIEARRLEPGDEISFGDLAQEVGVSRTPVREAIRQLQLEGLVEPIPGRGARVVTLNVEEVSDFYAVRSTLEIAAVRSAARNISELELGLLQGNLDRVQKSLKSPHMLARLDKQFHSVIYGASHNRYLEKSLKTLRVTMGLLHSNAYRDPSRGRASAKEHASILAALQHHDCDAAERAAITHIAGARQERLKKIAAGKD